VKQSWPLALMLALPLATAGAAAATEPPASRAQVVRHAIPRSVRVQVFADEELRRTASGVVVRCDATQEGPRSLVLTNAHVADPAGLGEVRYAALVEHRGRVERTIPARVLALGRVPELDLALLEVDAALPVAELATEEQVDVGDEVVVVGAPYGKALSVSGGLVSLLEADPAPEALRFKAMKTDAAIGYGSSGGGVFTVPGGRLAGIVEGYRTARVSMGEKLSFDVPMPGETFVAPVTKLRRFLADHAPRRAPPAAPEPAASPR
jgi:S1-C subfamily serine protease